MAAQSQRMASQGNIWLRRVSVWLHRAAHMVAQGQHMAAQGQHMTAQGQRMAAQGQHVAAQGQGSKKLHREREKPTCPAFIPGSGPWLELVAIVLVFLLGWLGRAGSTTAEIQQPRNCLIRRTRTFKNYLKSPPGPW